MSPILAGSLGSLLAGLATALGAVPLLVAPGLARRFSNAALGFAAGIMLSASFLSLMLPALEHAGEDYGGAWAASLVVGLGLLLGGAAVWLANETLPHEHFLTGPEGASAESLRRIWLFVFAITLHNFPEGLAVGVGYGGGDFARGNTLAIGIGLQNVAEGMAVAVALAAQGYSRRKAIGISALSGLVEPIGGVIGVTAVTVSGMLLPWGLAFAAGAMIFVISHEIIPETHRERGQGEATAGLMIGVVAMMALDHALG
ncbi:ZIP family metal transporter [Faunimonas sp. B44]|uniref:ZIP family metal transporter n=1 Tax=Faunimonas sp. B44 TaxID=3461493 RepID=UPI004043D8C3